MKKLFAVLLSIVLVLSMSTVAFAADADKGTITITNAVPGATYKVYKMLDFEPVAGANGEKGIYKVAQNWEIFFAPPSEKLTFTYFTVNNTNGEDDYPNIGDVVTVNEGVTEMGQDLINYAKAYAEVNASRPTASIVADSSTVVFENLDLGYYLIDTTVGTMGALTNTNNKLKAVEKNKMPDIDKFVQEDSGINNDGEGWSKVNDADIDDVVNYKSVVTVGLGAVNYIMHDTMDAGLTFNDDVVVKLADGTVVDASDYTVVYPAEDGHTFDVKFNDDFIATLKQDDTFTVYYSATLNEDAKIALDKVDDNDYSGNRNTVYLSCGENSEWKTAERQTSTYTWEIDVLKYTMDGENKVSLAGAVFQLLDKDGNAIKFSAVADVAVPTYIVDAEGEIIEITTDKDGKFEIIGLDEGAYKLHEVSAPEGYNKLAKDLDVVITSEYNEEDLTATYKINEEDPATIEVENKTGGLFPETGGIGTTIFYVVGALLMLAAVVILVSKKRMATFA